MAQTLPPPGCQVAEPATDAGWATDARFIYVINQTHPGECFSEFFVQLPLSNSGSARYAVEMEASVEPQHVFCTRGRALRHNPYQVPVFSQHRHHN